MLFVWNGTDAPPLDIHSKWVLFHLWRSNSCVDFSLLTLCVYFFNFRLEEELKNPLCLQLEEPPLSREVLCSFPTVGSVLRITADRCNARLALQLLKAGRWVQFRNIQFEAREGLWCGILMHSSKFSYLPDDNKVVLEFQRFSIHMSYKL